MSRNISEEVEEKGFAIIEDVFTASEISEILTLISNAETEKETFRKSNDLFAIRQFLKEVPLSVRLIFNEKLNRLIDDSFGDEYVVVKSIYFDKPENSNWFVAYHQDLTISVDKKVHVEGFGPWTVKQNQFSVQPPLAILQKNFTIRIHFDDTNSDNGALRIIPYSHLNGVCKNVPTDKETEVVCAVKKGGIMIMKPLLLHASGRTTNQKKRRVIHIEFSNQKLPNELQWSEYYDWRL